MSAEVFCVWHFAAVSRVQHLLAQVHKECSLTLICDKKSASILRLSSPIRQVSRHFLEGDVLPF